MSDKKVTTAAEMRSDLKESFNQFCVSGLWVISYFLVFPLILLGLSGGNMPYWLSCNIAGWLFVPVTGAINYLWGEHWYVGKKKWGFALVSLVVIVTSLAVHYLGQESKLISSSSVSSSIAAPTPWWADEIQVERNSQVIIGEVKVNDRLRSFSSNGHTILREGGDPNPIQGGVDMTTTFKDFEGAKILRLSGNGKTDAVIRYKIIRR